MLLDINKKERWDGVFTKQSSRMVGKNRFIPFNCFLGCSLIFYENYNGPYYVSRIKRNIENDTTMEFADSIWVVSDKDGNETCVINFRMESTFNYVQPISKYSDVNSLLNYGNFVNGQVVGYTGSPANIFKTNHAYRFNTECSNKWEDVTELYYIGDAYHNNKYSGSIEGTKELINVLKSLPVDLFLTKESLIFSDHCITTGISKDIDFSVYYEDEEVKQIISDGGSSSSSSVPYDTGIKTIRVNGVELTGKEVYVNTVVGDVRIANGNALKYGRAGKNGI